MYLSTASPLGIPDPQGGSDPHTHEDPACGTPALLWSPSAEERHQMAPHPQNQLGRAPIRPLQSCKEGTEAWSRGEDHGKVVVRTPQSHRCILCTSARPVLISKGNHRAWRYGVEWAMRANKEGWSFIREESFESSSRECSFVRGAHGPAECLDIEVWVLAAEHDITDDTYKAQHRCHLSTFTLAARRSPGQQGRTA